MNVDEKLSEKINRIAVNTFLSEGSYDDLQAAAEGDSEAEKRITIWQPFEQYELDYILDKVDDLANDITDLILDL